MASVSPHPSPTPTPWTAVPNYDLHGHQHGREPFKNLSHLGHENIRHARWLSPPPAVKTRSELLQARKRGRVPDTSYDFDGDGTIGSLDYFIGRSFDRDCDGRLSKNERMQASQAIENDFLDKYMRGLERTGDRNRGYALTQKRGQIIALDNGAEACAASYGPHHNAHKQPPHATRTALNMSRTAEMKGFGHAVGERFAEAMSDVREPMPPNAETEPRVCNIAHIRERAEADHQAARLRGGLLPMSTPVNPEREHRTVGIGYEASPVIATRSQLAETRKELMKQECEELRIKGEEHFPPLSVRRAAKEVREFDFRRAVGEPRTLTALKDERRRDRIEHNMSNFSCGDVMPREYPRFSDNPDVPFWCASAGSPSQGRQAPSPEHFEMVRSVSEPLLKVNELPWNAEVRELHSSLPEAAHEIGAVPNPNSEPAAALELGSKTVKRFTTSYLEHGQGRNKPRLFGNIQPIRTGLKDLEPLDITSSMEPIRTAALAQLKKERKNDKTNPRAGKLWAGNEESNQDMARRESRKQMAQQRSVERAASIPAMDMTSLECKREPRYFGSPDFTRPGSHGVRCGGFQRTDWLMQQSPYTHSATRLAQTQPPRSRTTRIDSTGLSSVASAASAAPSQSQPL